MQDLQLALAAYRRGEWEVAEQICRNILAAQPRHFDALHLCGIIALRTRRLQDAVHLLIDSVKVSPASAEANNSLGMAFSALKQHTQALGCLDRAISLRPEMIAAHVNRGSIMGELRRYSEALESFDRAIDLRPDSADAYYNRGVTLGHLGRHEAELESYERALVLDRAHPKALRNLGTVLALLGRHAESLEYLGRALQQSPQDDFLFGAWLHARLRICDWSDLERHFDHLRQGLERRERLSRPFPLLAMPLSPSLHRIAAELLVQDRYATSEELPAIARRSDDGRIHIGYFSADFHDHATCHLMAGTFESHDRSRFEITGFSFGPDTGDPVRLRVSKAFDRFIDVRDRSDREVAMLARDLGIDIAVDLKGFTENGRPGIFAMRAAPIQASFLGYPGTMGATCIDYLVADPTVVPEADRPFYTEKIVWLPESYQANDRTRPIAGHAYLRADVGLPSSGFVYCCFNNSYKILPGTFDQWMRILAAVDGSVLWLLADNEWASANLRREAARRGVAPERLVFAKRMPSGEHLARQRVADLFLDTLPYNAHTTASDALWAGVPVLTCLGDTFAGRVAASLLRAVGLPELIASTATEYEELAIALAMEPGRLAAVRETLQRNLPVAPLFDTRLHTQRLELAYTAMYMRHREGMPPDDIGVAS